MESIGEPRPPEPMINPHGEAIEDGYGMNTPEEPVLDFGGGRQGARSRHPSVRTKPIPPAEPSSDLLVPPPQPPLN
jgi:hypothetical protein